MSNALLGWQISVVVSEVSLLNRCVSSEIIQEFLKKM